jgi:hypothetical protein
MARKRKQGKATRNRGNQLKRIKMIQRNHEILDALKKEMELNNQ